MTVFYNASHAQIRISGLQFKVLIQHTHSYFPKMGTSSDGPIEDNPGAKKNPHKSNLDMKKVMWRLCQKSMWTGLKT